MSTKNRKSVRRVLTCRICETTPVKLTAKRWKECHDTGIRPVCRDCRGYAAASLEPLTRIDLDQRLPHVGTFVEGTVIEPKGVRHRPRRRPVIAPLPVDGTPGNEPS